VPVIVNTAFPETEVDGAAVILQKPFDVDTLLATVARLYEGRREHQHHVSASDELRA
jgi:DNA-binding NtrC family response regulator